MEEFDPERISGIFLEFERLANRVEHSATHYQALGVEYGVSLEQLKQAYRDAVSLIQPIYSGRFRPVEPGFQAKAARVLRKTSNAFAVLSNFGKRIEYDNLLFKRKPGLAAAAIPSKSEANDVTGDRGLRLVLPGATPAPLVTQPLLAGLQKIVQSEIESADGNRRRYARFELSVPVTMVGHDRINGKWDELAQTLDVSRNGARLMTGLTLRHGSVVHLSFPMPINLRSYGFGDPVYKVYAIARRIGPSEGGPRAVGLEFLGQNPPAGYLDRPWAAYRTECWDGAERRREPREQKSEVVSVKYLNESQAAFRQEIALTENLSSGGAMIYVKGAPPEVEFIRLANLTRSFESLARICDRYIGSDGLERISLQFLERKWLLE